MKRALIIFALLTACKAKLPLIDKVGDPPTGLSVTTAKCLIATTTDPFPFSYTLTAAATVVVEVDAADGTSTVVFRQNELAGANGTLSVPANAFTAGQNTVSVWSYAVGRASETKTFTVTAVVPADPTAPNIDADGDCWTVREGDCDDRDATINPTATEVCNNKIDDNCDGLVDFHDPECKGQCADNDNDGYASAVCGGDDCDDGDPLINPGQTELCNGVDDNCNGKTDETFDADGDGFVTCPTGTAYVPFKQVNGRGCPTDFESNVSPIGTCPDCDDADPTTYPGAFEPCEPKVHSCDRRITLADKTADVDGDGYPNCSDPDSDNDGWCDPGAALVLTIKACDNPNTPDGLCCTGADNCKNAQNQIQSDADGDGIGDACDTCTDVDGDGYGRGGPEYTFTPNTTLQPTGQAALGTSPFSIPIKTPQSFDNSVCIHAGNDCMDTSDPLAASVHPGAVDGPASPASCDAVDNDCSCPYGVGGNSRTWPPQNPFTGAGANCIDDGFDADKDGYTTCTATTGILSTGAAATLARNDCNDGNAHVYPTAHETDLTANACDGVDNNCDGTIDEQYDLDGDTYTSCGQASGTRTNGMTTDAQGAPLSKDDCNDDPANGGAAMFPGNPEICDGLDNDCSCPYGVVGSTSHIWPPPAAGFGVTCIDNGWDSDGDGYAGAMKTPHNGSVCPSFLPYTPTGKACTSSVTYAINTSTGARVANQASCFDCDQCGGSGEAACPGGAPAGSAVHPLVSGDATIETGTACRDGIDNDCDGFIDSVDADCTSCPNQTVLLAKNFADTSGLAAGASYGTARWELRQSSVAPSVVDFSEGAANTVWGTDGNNGANGPEQENSSWILGRTAPNDPSQTPSTANMTPFNFTGSSGLTVYLATRSWTNNSGTPAWTTAGPSFDGGNCGDGRGSGWNMGMTDLEYLRVATGTADPTVCTNDASGGYVNVMDCLQTPDLDRPYDAQWRLLKADVTAAIAGNTQAYMCGRFITNEAGGNICFGGPPLEPWLGVYNSCSATNMDDGWYLDDMVLYACDPAAGGACSSSQFACGKSACCTAASQYCDATNTCQNVSAGDVPCNQTQCAPGYYCADFQNSRCSVSNVNTNCGPLRANCNSTPGKVCAYVSSGAEIFPSNPDLPSDCRDPAGGGLGSAASSECQCIVPNVDTACGTNPPYSPDAVFVPRRNCTLSISPFTSAPDHCDYCKITFGTNCISVGACSSDTTGSGKTNGADCFCSN